MLGWVVPSVATNLRKSRSALAGIAALLALAAPHAQTALEPTLQTHTGPWYRPGAPEASSLWQPGAPGRPLYLRGVVLDTGARPIAGALVEFWHTDSTGSYPPLRASVRADEDGSFGIRTVLPGHNRGHRARHIHFVVSHPAHHWLVTRIYFRGDPNMDEAPWPELAILLDEGTVEERSALFGSLQFVLRPL
jgi:protocatechuate 3,4-dioxygenase beta subunit